MANSIEQERREKREERREKRDKQADIDKDKDIDIERQWKDGKVPKFGVPPITFYMWSFSTRSETNLENSHRPPSPRSNVETARPPQFFSDAPGSASTLLWGEGGRYLKSR